MGDQVIQEVIQPQQSQEDHQKTPKLEDIVGDIVEEIFQKRLKTAEEQHLTQRQSIQTYSESLNRLQENAEKLLQFYVIADQKNEDNKAHKRIQSAVAPAQLAVIKESVNQPAHMGMHHYAPSAVKLTNNTSANGAGITQTSTVTAEKHTVHPATTRNTPASSMHQSAGEKGGNTVQSKTHVKSDKQPTNIMVTKKKETTTGAINSAKEDKKALNKQIENNEESLVSNSNNALDSVQILSELNIKGDQKEGTNNSSVTSESNTKQEISTEQLETASDSLQTNSIDRKSLGKTTKQPIVAKKQQSDEKIVKSVNNNINKTKGNEDQKSKEVDDSKGIKGIKKQDISNTTSAASNGGTQRKVIPKITDLKTQRELIKNKQKETDQQLAGKTTDTNTRKSIGVKKEEGGVTRQSISNKKEDHIGVRQKTEESLKGIQIPGKKVGKINNDKKSNNNNNDEQDDKNKKKVISSNNDNKIKNNGNQDNKDSKGQIDAEVKTDKDEKNVLAVEVIKEVGQDDIKQQKQEVVVPHAEDEDLLANIENDQIQGEEQSQKKDIVNGQNDIKLNQGNGQLEQNKIVEEFNEKKLEQLLNQFSNSEIDISELKDYCLKNMKSKDIIEDKIIFSQINLQNELEALQTKVNASSSVIPEVSSFVFKLSNSTKEGLSLVDSGFFDDILSKEELDSKIVSLFELLLMIVDENEIKEMRAETNKDLFVRNYLNEVEDSFTSVLEGLESKGQQLILNYPLKKQIQGFITEHEYVLDQNEYTSLDPLSSIIAPILKEIVIFAGIKESTSNKGNVGYFQSQEIESKQKQIQEINDLIVQIS